MTNTVIRVAGPYTISTDGNRIYCNGQQTSFSFAPKDSGLAWVVDTGAKGANGKRDYVGITAEQYAIHTALSEQRAAAERAAISPERIAQINAEARAEKALDAAYNEGGEGYNPHRDGPTDLGGAVEPQD